MPAIGLPKRALSLWTGRLQRMDKFINTPLEKSVNERGLLMIATVNLNSSELLNAGLSTIVFFILYIACDIIAGELRVYSSCR